MLKHKNKDSSQPATVGDFQELAHSMADIAVTKDEFNEFKDTAFKTFATKNDLDNFAKKALKTFATKEDIQELKKEIPTKNELTKFKDEILSSNDKLMHEVKAMREEQHAHSGNHKDIVEDVQNLKHRMSAVEQHIGMEPVSVSA